MNDEIRTLDAQFVKLIEEKTKRRKRVIFWFFSAAVLGFIIGISLLVWSSNKQEAECKARGGEMHCRSWVGVMNGQTAVMTSCECTK